VFRDNLFQPGARNTRKKTRVVGKNPAPSDQGEPWGKCRFENGEGWKKEKVRGRRKKELVEGSSPKAVPPRARGGGFEKKVIAGIAGQGFQKKRGALLWKKPKKKPKAKKRKKIPKAA